jgi:hypothetical protein
MWRATPATHEQQRSAMISAGGLACGSNRPAQTHCFRASEFCIARFELTGLSPPIEAVVHASDDLLFDPNPLGPVQSFNPT